MLNVSKEIGGVNELKMQHNLKLSLVGLATFCTVICPGWDVRAQTNLENTQIIRLNQARFLNTNELPHQQESQARNDQLLPMSIDLHTRMGMVIGEAPVSGGGVGLNYLLGPGFVMHTEANGFFSYPKLMSFMFPLTFRYFLTGSEYGPYFGLGGFLVIAQDGQKQTHFPAGGMIEFGMDFVSTPEWTFGFGCDYGLGLTPAITHTFGLQAKLQWSSSHDTF